MKQIVKTKSVKMNMIMNAILTMSSFIFPLVTFPYVSRILLPVGTGKVSFATSVISYFSMFAQLGIPTYGVRACAKVRDDKEKLSRTVHEIMFINLFMCVIAYIALFVSMQLVPRFRQDKLLLMVVSSTILLNSIGVEWLYKSLEQYSYITVRSIAFKFIALVFMFLFIHEEKDYVIYGGISIFASSASGILNFINLRKYIYFRPMGGYDIKKHIKMVVVFFAMSVATTIYTHLDTVMLGFMKSDVETGYYSAAVKIKSILVGVVTAASGVLLPRVTYYIQNGNREDFIRIAKKTLNFVFITGAAFAVYFIIFAHEGIYFLSGSAYENSIVPMQVIMPTVLLIGLTNVMGIQMMVPLGKEKLVLYSEIAGAVINLIINAVLIPRLASTGAAIGTLVAEIVVWIVQYVSIRNMLKTAYRSIKYLRIVFGLMLASAASVWVKFIDIKDFLKLIISGVLFFGIYFGILVITKEPLITELKNQALGKLKGKK